MSREEQAQGKKLLSAVESLIVHPNALIRLVDQLRKKVPIEQGVSEQTYFRKVGERIVTHYSRRTALAGTLSAAPGLIPGGGTLLAVVGGNLADMAFTLKFEVEMTLCLTHLYGFDITDERERQLAFLLASVSTYEAHTRHHILRDFAASQGQAVWNYTPRQLSKVLLSVMTKLALLSLSKGVVKALPLVGMAISGGLNKILTTRIGHRTMDELSRRRWLLGQEDKQVIEADFER